MPDDALWVLTGPALRKKRRAKKLSAAALATKSGVGERSVWRYEKGGVAVPYDIAKCLADVLECAPEDIAKPPAQALRDPRLPKPSPLETIVATEERSRALPPVMIARTRYPLIRAATFQDIHTAWLTHEGEMHAVSGVVRAQERLTAAEATVLGVARGAGARFHVFVPIAGGELLGVTVHTRTVEDTKCLQSLRSRKATMLVRVVVAPGDPADGAPGFESFISTGTRAWALAVEIIGGK